MATSTRQRKARLTRIWRTGFCCLVRVNLYIYMYSGIPSCQQIPDLQAGVDTLGSGAISLLLPPFPKSIPPLHLSLLIVKKSNRRISILSSTQLLETLPILTFSNAPLSHFSKYSFSVSSHAPPSHLLQTPTQNRPANSTPAISSLKRLSTCVSASAPTPAS